MLKFVLILSVFSIIPFKTESVVEDNKKIDFWTNTIDDILIRFRIDRNTHELVMFQEEDEDDNLKSGQDSKPKSVNKQETTSAVGPAISSTTSTTSTTLAPVILTNEDDSFETSLSEATYWATDTITPLNIDTCALNCSSERPHIACGHNWSLSPLCPPTARVINLDPLKQVILQTHNNFRNLLAGNLTNFEPAARMGTTQWHSELAAFALLNVMQCNDLHDMCHNTNEFRKPGQNLAKFSWTGSNKNLKTIIIKLINDWYTKEVLYAQQSDMDNFTRFTGLNNKIILHFSAIVNERNTHIGCAAVCVKSGQWTTLYFACNYARNNVLKRAIYEKGETASKCLTGINPEYKNLCSIKEIYNYNN